MTGALPPGFVLDPIPGDRGTGARLPLGFVLDKMATQPQQPNIAHKGGMKPGDRVPADLHASTVQGITIGAGDELAAGATAPIKALENTIRGEGPTSLGENYDQQKAFLDAQLARTYEEHPYLAPATEFAGAMLVPGGTGARVAIKAPSLVSKIARGSGMGAALTGAYGFNTGDTLQDRFQRGREGLWTGAIVGGAVPLAGAGLGRGYRAVTDAFGGPRTQETLQAFTRSGIRPTAGAVTGSRPIQMVEQAFANTPGSSGRMLSTWGQQADDLVGSPGTELEFAL